MINDRDLWRKGFHLLGKTVLGPPKGEELKDSPLIILVSV
jgi:hypothetical protein